MKNTPLILSIIALVAVAAIGILQLLGTGNKKSTSAGASTEAVAAKGAIVYINLDRVVNEYDMANELKSSVQSKVESIQQEVNRRGNKLQSDVNSYQDKVNKGLLTRSVAEAQYNQLGQRQQEFQNYASQKDQEVNEELQVMNNQIGNAIKEFLDKYEEQMGYAMILTTQGDILPAPVVAGDAALDITDAVIAGLNDEYIKTKSNGSKAAAPAAEKNEETPAEK